MTVTIIATAGASNANSYITVADGDALANVTLGTLKWATATTDNKGRALIMATRYLDQLSWVGTKASTTQSLVWPRTDAACGELSYSNTVIPSPVKQACFDLAEALLTTPTLLSTTGPGNAELIPGIPNASLKSARVDVIAVDFRDGAIPSSRNALNVLPGLRQTLGCLCASVPVGTGNVKVLRS